jgi:hypothetical protein
MTQRLLLTLFLSFLALPAFADADLQLISNSPSPANSGLPPFVVNTDVTLSVAVYNEGPDVARNVRVTINVPPGLPIRALSQNCDVTHLPVVCTGGDLAVTKPQQNPLGFAVAFTVPSKSTSLTFGATVSSDTPDPIPSNNSFTRTIDVVEVAWLVAHNVVSPQRADPGTTTVAKTDVVNFVPSVPQDIHMHYEATNETIESIDAPARWSCSIDGGATADCVAQSLDNFCRCSGTINVTLRLKNDRAGGTATLKTSVSNSLPPLAPLPIEATSSTEIYRWIVVSSTADAGAGSLRAAIDEANRGCSEACKIAFEIPAPVPEAGWFTIAPSTPLPPVTAPRVFVDAKTQSAFTGDTNPAGPEIAIDGHAMASGFGLESRSGCEGIIEGFSIGNVADYGIAMTSSARCQSSETVDQHRIARNYIGVDPSGMVAAPNQRGLLIDNAFAEIADNVISGNLFSGLWSWQSSLGVHRNLIGTAADGKTPLPNGRSGIFIGPLVKEAEVLQNTISFNAEMGVAAARGAQLVDIRQNSMRDNGGLGIDIGLDGPNAPVTDDHLAQGNAPVLLSAVYDPVTKRTAITLTLSTSATAPYGNAVYVDLYSNDKPDGDGEKWITDAYLANANGDISTISVPGDLRGKWINATAMRVHFLAAKPPSPEFFAGGETTTSEFGNAVLSQ